MRPLDINREFPIIELKVLGACLGPTIFTVRYLVSYLVRCLDALLITKYLVRLDLIIRKESFSFVALRPFFHFL